MTITGLRLQKKKRAGQISVLIQTDDQSEKLVDVDTIAQFDLHKGMFIETERWAQVCDFDELRVSSRKVVNLLSIRPRSRQELYERLVRDGFREMIVEQTLRRFEENGYLNDADFALRFAKSKLQKKRMGVNALRHELIRKGLSKDVIEKTLDNLVGDRDELAVALEAAKKKNKTLREPDSSRRLKKLVAFLAQRGFEMDICFKAAERILRASI